MRTEKEIIQSIQEAERILQEGKELMDQVPEQRALLESGSEQLRIDGNAMLDQVLVAFEASDTLFRKILAKEHAELEKLRENKAQAGIDE